MRDVMIDASAISDAIDAHLAEDEVQLRRVVEQAAAVRDDFDHLMARLRHEIDASTVSIPGACHLRG